MSADPLITIDTDVDREVLIQTITQAAEDVIGRTSEDEATPAPPVLVAVTLTFRLLSGEYLMGMGKLLMTPEERDRLVADFTSGAAQGAYTYFRETHELSNTYRLHEHRLAVRFADLLCLY